jgi:L-malate glycosyltransferase
MRVLYVNQTAAVSGAERSLLTLIDSVEGRLNRIAACPAGDLEQELLVRGVPVHRTPATDASFRLHPLHTPRALAEMAVAALRVTAAARRSGAQLVHANTTRAGLIAVLAHRLGAPPTVVHIRDGAPPGRVSSATLHLLRAEAAAIIANSSWTASHLPPGRAPVEVLHNPVDLKRFDPESIDRTAARAALGFAPDEEVIGVIGQFTPWKGQAEAVAALAELSRRRPRARLIIVGSAKFTAASTRYDNVAYARTLRAAPARLGLQHAVRFLGERTDVPQVLRALDVLVVPSWHEAFGRVAAEGLAMGVPVIATAVGGPAEIVRDGLDGRVLPPKDPRRWADALDELLGRPEVRMAMGRRGRERAAVQFAPDAHADAVSALYRELIDRAPRVRSG